MKTISDYISGLDGFIISVAPFIPLLLLFVAYYFLFYRPQRRAQLEFEKMLETVGIGAQLITRGGMVGVVVEILPHSFILSLYDGAKAEVLKEAIVSVIHE